MQRDALDQGLIVSCQPVPDGPMDRAEMVVGFALAAMQSGASALRIESAAYVRAVRAATDAPIIGIVKRDLDDSPVRITPFIADVEALADAGADVIAFDATDRVRPATIEALIEAAKARGKLTMADCSCLEDARQALAAGVDFVGTTLSGYVGPDEPEDPDLPLIAAMRQLTPYVIAEGRIRNTQQAAAAAEAGAFCVVVGSAITRTEHATSWFREALDSAFAARANAMRPVLAIDIGGTKSLATIMEDGVPLREIQIPTRRDAGPDQWLADIAESIADWRGSYAAIGIAVTGAVDKGNWSALNTATLDIPGTYPLAEKASGIFAAPVFAMNDAQAAAWGEYRFGGHGAENIVFLTISTGIGGGIVLNGKPLLGIAGHFGLLRGPSAGAAPLEDQVSGRWIAAEASAAGHAMEAPEVFAAARAGADWAQKIVETSAARTALLCRDIQMMIDPDCIVIGGGIGLAAGYREQVEKNLDDVPARLRPRLVAATLGGKAGAIGVADLARRNGENTETA